MDRARLPSRARSIGMAASGAGPEPRKEAGDEAVSGLFDHPQHVLEILIRPVVGVGYI